MFQHLTKEIKHAFEWYCEQAADLYVWSPKPLEHDARKH